MASVPPASSQPTDLAALPELLAYTQQLDLTPHLERPKRGLSTLAASLLWLCLAWRGSGRPYHLQHLHEPLLAAILVATVPRQGSFVIDAAFRTRLTSASDGTSSDLNTLLTREATA
jgi:hypothetical protein